MQSRVLTWSACRRTRGPIRRAIVLTTRNELKDETAKQVRSWTKHFRCRALHTETKQHRRPTGSGHRDSGLAFPSKGSKDQVPLHYRRNEGLSRVSPGNYQREGISKEVITEEPNPIWIHLPDPQYKPNPHAISATEHTVAGLVPRFLQNKR